MLHFEMFLRRLPGALLAFGALAFPGGAFAQDLPSYAQPAVVSTDETVHGRIASVDGAFSIRVNDDRGFVDTVVLHNGTIINPTGLTLSAGMSVTIAGYNAGSAFEANEIDTPYSYSGDLPVPNYYGPGYWYPGFAYGYGPSFSLICIFGGGFERFEHRPFYGRPWNGRAYFGPYVGEGSGSRVFIGERRAPHGDSNIDRRAYTSAVRDRGSNVPQAFAGRSFAGASQAVDGRGALRYPSRSAGGERTFAPAVRGGTIAPNRFSLTQSRFAGAPAGRSYGGAIRTAPAMSGGARSTQAVRAAGPATHAGGAIRR